MLGASVAVLVAPAGPASSAVCPSPGACVAVHLVGDRQGEAVVPVTDLQAWANAEGNPPRDYRVRESDGSTDTVLVSQSLPLRLFVDHLADQGGAFAGLSADDITLVKIPRPNIGYTSVLDGPQLGPGGSNGFVDRQEAVLYTPGGTDTIAYARPLTDSSDDVNELDVFQSGGNAALDITISTTGTVLSPTITASPTNPSAGQTVTFTASVPDAPAGTTYAWTFGGGGTATGPTASHAWTAAGTWGVGLVVEAPDNSYGRAATVVTVGDPPPPTSPPTASPTPGGGGGTGTGTGQSPSPSPTVTGKPVPTPNSSPSPSSSPTATGTPSATATPTSEPSPTGSTQTPEPSPTRTPEPEPTADPPGDSVTGLLLSSAEVSEPGADPTRPDPSSTVTPVATPLDVPTALVWSMILVALLAAGAASELRPRRPWRRTPQKPQAKETA